MATQDLSETSRATSVDRSQIGGRGGSIGMVLLVAIALVGAAVGLLLVGRGNAGPYILGLLAFLAMAGVFSLFALATGILRVAGQDMGASPMLKMVVDDAVDGLLVTDPRGRVIYANAALEFYPASSTEPAPPTPDKVYSLNTNNETYGVNSDQTPKPTKRSTQTDAEHQKDLDDWSNHHSLKATFDALPTNITRVYLDVIAESQGDDEFWLIGSGNTFREMHISIDGKSAGVAGKFKTAEPLVDEAGDRAARRNRNLVKLIFHDAGGGIGGGGTRKCLAGAGLNLEDFVADRGECLAQRCGCIGFRQRSQPATVLPLPKPGP